MSEAIPCLVRVGDNVQKNKLIKLDRDQVTIGRSGDVNYQILSTMISRCHAIIQKQENGKWTITDNKSLNGVYVNGRQLNPSEASVMMDGDMVQFGVPTSPNVPAEFIYKFYVKVRLKKETSKRTRNSLADSEDTKYGSQNEPDDDEVKKRKIEKPDVDTPSTSSKEAEYQARLAQMEKLLKEKELKQSEVEKQLEKEKEEREKNMKEVEELRLKEQTILMEMQDKQARLDKEKEELEQQIRAEMEANLKAKEEALKSQLADKKQFLLDEKTRIEELLQTEMAKALEVKSKEVEERLVSMKENLEKVIEKKDNEQKVLEARLNQTKEENETAKLQALKAREDVLSGFVDLMEMELQCTICNELFIKATALNCAHVFCKLCISQWMKVKKECPNCRMVITSHMQAIALDSYIEKMVEQFTDDLREKRKELLDQRKVDQDKFDSGPSTTVEAAGQGRGRGRGRNRRGRGGRNGRGRGSIGRTTTPVSIAQTVANPLIMTVRAPPLTSTATAALRSLIPVAGRVPPIASSSELIQSSTSTTVTSTNTITPIVVGDTTVTTPIVLGDTSTTTPIVLNDSLTSSVPITLSDSEFDEDLAEDLFYSRYRIRRRGRLESDSDTNDTSNSEGDDDDSSIEGVPSEYYGGYGRCFKCGSRGHWANGCPF